MATSRERYAQRKRTVIRAPLLRKRSKGVSSEELAQRAIDRQLLYDDPGYRTVAQQARDERRVPPILQRFPRNDIRGYMNSNKRPNPYSNLNFGYANKKQRIRNAARAGPPALLIQHPPRNIVRYQQTHPGGEIKSVDIVGTAGVNSQTAFTLNTTPQFTALNLLTVGSSAWNRVGRKVTLKSVHLQGYFNEVGNQSGVSFARIMIIYDKQPNGALPVVSDVLLSQANSASDSNVSLNTSGLNLNNKDRFEVIVDRRFEFPCAQTAVASTPTSTTDFTSINIYKRLMNREVHYKADSAPGVIGDIATGSLFMLNFGSNASGGDPFGLLATIRVRYSDL